MGGWGGGLGWVSDRDAQHHPLTRNATKGQKGDRNYAFSHILTKKIGVEIRHFPHFCSNIGVETIHIFKRPEKGRSKWRSICSNLQRVSTLLSVGFRIGMLSTTRWLEMLQRAKKGIETIHFLKFWQKNRGRNTPFSSFLLKYRGRNYTHFQETWKREVEMAEHM